MKRARQRRPCIDAVEGLPGCRRLDREPRIIALRRSGERRRLGLGRSWPCSSGLGRDGEACVVFKAVVYCTSRPRLEPPREAESRSTAYRLPGARKAIPAFQGEVHADILNSTGLLTEILSGLSTSLSRIACSRRSLLPSVDTQHQPAISSRLTASRTIFTARPTFQPPHRAAPTPLSLRESLEPPPRPSEQSTSLGAMSGYGTRRSSAQQVRGHARELFTLDRALTGAS